MDFIFNCTGHRNITALHRNTLEFTKEKKLNIEGDCIVGVEADFNIKKLKEFVKKNKEKTVRCNISCSGSSDLLRFYLNEDFSHDSEIVIRKTDFLSRRTLGILSDKAAKDLNRGLIELMRDKNAWIEVRFLT
jgi:hypothetical protein